MKHALGLVAVVFLSSPAFAQSPIPVTATSGVSFTDADHTALNADGIPAVTRYELRFIPPAGCAAVPTADLGKPAADGTGLILAKPIAAFGSLPANCVYTALLAAIGPGGEGVSAPSDPFVRVVAKVPASPSKPAVLR